VGATRRLLSQDDETRASTAVLDCPAGWTTGLLGAEALLEVLVVDGELDVAGETLPRTGYIRVERGLDVGGLAAPRGAQLLVMEDPAAEPRGEDPIVLDAGKLPWTSSKHGGPAGIANKELWAAGPKGPVTKLIANVPLYWSGPEFHECVEEFYVLQGDVTGRAGTMTAGAYVWRLPYMNHGPYWSEGGLALLLRGHGELYAHWHDDPDATPEQNREYAARLRAAGKL
jgi:hypothetical protein